MRALARPVVALVVVAAAAYYRSMLVNPAGATDA
jgi:hypothetical protein